MTLMLALLVAAAPAVEQLPVVARLHEPRGTPFVVRGRLSKARGEELTALARAVQRDVTRRFLSGADHSAAPPVDLCLFETTAAYRAFATALLDGAAAPSELGFYDPGRRVVVANLGLSVGNLRHEMAHAIIGDDWPAIPSWLTEGVGALYGTAAQQKDGRFRFLANYRLRHLREAKRAGTVPTLAELASSSAAEVYGERAMVFYGLARHLLLYLDRAGTLRAFLDDSRAATTVEEQRRQLEKHVDLSTFLGWIDTLTIGT